MKKIIFFILAFCFKIAAAQPADYFANDWDISFSADMKTAILVPSISMPALNARRFNFKRGPGNVLTESFSVPGLNPITWMYKISPNPNKFNLYKNNVAWGFTYLSTKNGKHFYSMSLTYKRDNQFATLFTDPIIKNRQFSFDVPAYTYKYNYTLSKYGAYWYTGPIKESDPDNTYSRGLYALNGNTLYYLPLLLTYDNTNFTCLSFDYAHDAILNTSVTPATIKIGGWNFSER